MPIATVNAAFVTPDEWQEATRGMTNVVEVKVLPSMETIPGLDSKKNNGKGVARNQVLAGSPRFLSRGT